MQNRITLITTFFLSGSVVLSYKDGKCISEITDRHICDRVDLDCHGKCCHNGRSEAVDNSLHDQNTEIHHGLLQTGKTGK